MRRSLRLVLLLAAWHALVQGPGARDAACEPPSAVGPKPPSTRAFRLGFTRWPSDLTPQGVKASVDFAHAHGDLVSVMFIGGVPWPEAYAGKPFSQDVEQALAYRPPAGTRVLLSISPLDQARHGMAPWWGAKDNLPLPRPWDARALNSPEVKQAYLAFTLRAVEALKPDVLAAGIELNALLSHDPEGWKQAKDLYRATYAGVKARHPDLPVCFTTEVNHLKGLHTGSEAAVQAREVADLLKQSDLFALSLYPYMSHGVPRPVPDDFLDFAPRYGKPVCVSESGFTSRDVTLASYGLTLRGSEDEQSHWLRLLLATAARDRYRFVVQFAGLDFERLVERLPPPTADLARIWCFTGLAHSDGRAKPALAVWEAWRRAALEPPAPPAR